MRADVRGSKRLTGGRSTESDRFPQPEDHTQTRPFNPTAISKESLFPSASRTGQVGAPSNLKVNGFLSQRRLRARTPESTSQISHAAQSGRRFEHVAVPQLTEFRGLPAGWKTREEIRHGGVGQPRA